MKNTCFTENVIKSFQVSNNKNEERIIHEFLFKTYSILRKLCEDVYEVITDNKYELFITWKIKKVKKIVPVKIRNVGRTRRKNLEPSKHTENNPDNAFE